MSKSQRNFNWLLRRLNEPSMIEHMSEIVYEGTWHINGCDYSSFEEYMNLVLDGSVETFINSYEDHFEGKQGIVDLENYLYDLFKKRYRKYLLGKFNDDFESC